MESATLEPTTETANEYPKNFDATYSPEDNKLRLYSVGRLDSELYAQVRAHGFIYAPKQGFFVAPMWTPEREAFLLTLCDQIDAEESTLEERQAERVERFKSYEAKRLRESQNLQSHVSGLLDGIPLGQPILIGHHSQRRAEKMAENIQNAMSKSVSLWETSEYWKQRARASSRLAGWKADPGLRNRRIKKLRSDLKTVSANRDIYLKRLTRWEGVESHLAALHVAKNLTVWQDLNMGKITWQEARDQHEAQLMEGLTRSERWVQHFELRIAYETEMLGGVLASDTWAHVRVGDRVRARHDWLTVLRVNKKDGVVVSFTTNDRFVRVKDVSEIREHQPGEAGQAEAVKTAQKMPPIVNVKIEGCLELTSADWNKTYGDFKIIEKVRGTETFGPHRMRYTVTSAKNWKRVPVFLTDKPVIELPAPTLASSGPVIAAPSPALPVPSTPRATIVEPSDDAKNIVLMRESMKAGVQAIGVDQLFETPTALIHTLLDGVEIRDDTNFLEPSAGTGKIAQAVSELNPNAHMLLVEVNHDLAKNLNQKFGTQNVLCADFLEFLPVREFNLIIMNPPFRDGVDIQHIQHAFDILAVGGVLRALCANGPRQKVAFTEFFKGNPTFEYEPVEEPGFTGTNVRVAKISVRKVAK